jgi:hypothetical protein
LGEIARHIGADAELLGFVIEKANKKAKKVVRNTVEKIPVIPLYKHDENGRMIRDIEDIRVPNVLVRSILLATASGIAPGSSEYIASSAAEIMAKHNWNMKEIEEAGQKMHVGTILSHTEKYEIPRAIVLARVTPVKQTKPIPDLTHDSGKSPDKPAEIGAKPAKVAKPAPPNADTEKTEQKTTTTKKALTPEQEAAVIRASLPESLHALKFIEYIRTIGSGNNPWIARKTFVDQVAAILNHAPDVEQGKEAINLYTQVVREAYFDHPGGTAAKLHDVILKSKPRDWEKVISLLKLHHAYPEIVKDYVHQHKVSNGLTELLAMCKKLRPV